MAGLGLEDVTLKIDVIGVLLTLFTEYDGDLGDAVNVAIGVLKKTDEFDSRQLAATFAAISNGFAIHGIR